MARQKPRQTRIRVAPRTRIQNRSNTGVADAPPSDRRPRGAAAWILGAYLLCLTGFYLDVAVTPNSASRVVATLSLLQTGSLAIDHLADYTQDKSYVGGHYYSDKAPLPSLLFAIPEWILEKGAPSRSLKVLFERALALGGFFFASVPLAMFGLWLVVDGLSLPATVVVICGTLLWVYAGTFFGHVFAGFLVVLAYRAVFRNDRPFVGGLYLGAAFLTEYPTAIAWPAFTLSMLGAGGVAGWRARLSPMRLEPVLRLSAGFLAAAVLILPYNAAITGNPFRMVYSYVSDPAFRPMREHLGFRASSMAQGFWGLLFSPARGLFVFAPIATLAIVRGHSWLRRLQTRTLAPVSVVFFAASLALFSSYYLWSGGGAYGPRHLIPAFMLVIFEVTPLAAADERRARPWLRWGVLAVMAITGVLPALAAKLTLKYILPDWYASPLTDLILPALRDGRWNGDGLPSLLLGWTPLASLWCFAALAIAGGVLVPWVMRRGHRTSRRPIEQ